MENAPNNLDHSIVDYVIDTYYSRYKYLHYEDMFSYGLEGLYEADAIYDPTKSDKPFKYFATCIIRRRIFRYVRDIMHKFLFNIDFTDNNTFLENFDSTPPVNIEHIDLINVLKTLDNKYKSVIYYKYYKGYNYQQISKILGVNWVTVKNRLNKALKLIKERLWTTN